MQTNEPVTAQSKNTYSRPSSAGKQRERPKTIGFASDWLRMWREYFNQSQSEV